MAEVGKTYNILYYTQFDGAWVISDSSILKIWERMVDENAVKKIFYAKEIVDPESFIHYLKSPATFPFFIYEGDRFKVENIVGFVWLTNARAKCALMHFCIFKNGYGKGPELSQEVFKYIFNLHNQDGQRVIACIRGETPKFNRLAIRYLKTIGMEIVGEIPHMAVNKYTGETSSMVISYKTFEEFGGDYDFP